VESGGRQALRDLLQTWSARTVTFEPEDHEMLKSIVSSATLDLSCSLRSNSDERRSMKKTARCRNWVYFLFTAHQTELPLVSLKFAR
jgi:hypothetical protein